MHGNVEAEYVDAGKTVLVNRQGIVNLRELYVREEEGLTKAYGELLGEVRTDTALSCGLLQRIHELIFGDLYEWAGRWRTVCISKPGIMWPPPEFLEKGMQEFEETVLRRYPSGALRSDGVFCRAVAHIQGEFLAIHPFREGNARTIKLATNLLAAQTKRPPLRYDEGKGGQRRYIAAAQAAISHDFGPMTEIVWAALRAAAPRP
ncbi:hypothetical protein A2264_01860 [candidate division WWE3 bacterium RIFOXYA2_FULL_46_9]|uniref:protein adenylyltransferase n=1 Tax=candidate division WWE3 bacterium RIFOXYA2_FULL_46_9 TaxID=1802636 RepID=A0A1F4W0P7_UNCKA|nr:MAG: hypothetical protein A2264_01860 [candidate division WWE3 bacterium RIFOXYA2_FULL_46_9]